MSTNFHSAPVKLDGAWSGASCHGDGTFTRQAGVWVGIRASADWLNCFNKIDKKDSKIDFEMSVIVVEAIRGRCASFMILTATVSD